MASVYQLDFLKRAAIFWGALVFLVHIFLSPVLAAHLLVIDDSERWELGFSVSGSSVSKRETSLIHLTESYRTVSRRDMVVNANFRPISGQRWSLSAHHASYFQEVEVINLGDPIGMTHEFLTSKGWRSLDLRYEQKWVLPRQRSIHLDLGANLCSFESLCRIAVDQMSVSYARIVDPVVVGVNLGLAAQKISSDVLHWTPTWSGAVEVVINASLALGSLLSLQWTDEGNISQAIIGQKIVWRFNPKRLMTVGIHTDLLSNEPTLSVALQTRL